MKKTLALLLLLFLILRLVFLCIPSQADTESGTEDEAAVPSGTPTVQTAANREAPARSPAAASPTPTATAAPSPESSPTAETEIVATTIAGGALAINNATSYEIDAEALLAEPLALTLPSEGYQILILHTHGSEAYTPTIYDAYEESDAYRTQDASRSVIKVGDVLAQALEAQGLRVLHDTGVYDYPSYTGSYGRSLEAAEAILAEHPEISVVIDLHRDALGSDGVVYKTVATGSGEAAAQVMLVMGTGENGLSHPNWRENLKLALRMQQAMCALNPTLARPIALRQERYNQQLTAGTFILEVGSNGNTLSEALCAVKLFAQSVGPLLKSMVA